MKFMGSPKRFVDARHDITETDKARMKYRELYENKFRRDTHQEDFDISFANALKAFMVLLLFITGVVVIFLVSVAP